jgi:hypothetical protein
MTEMNTKTLDFNHFLKNGFTYTDYLNLLKSLLEKGYSTGGHNTEEYQNYAKLNLQRMERGDKTFQLNPELESVLKTIERPISILVITEGWCGDAAQNIPVFAGVEKSSDGKIEVKLVLRDENPELMDAFLTNGSRSIPIAIFLDKETSEVFATWGPRPIPAQTLLMQYKSNPDRPKSEFYKDLHVWYSMDKGQTLQLELASIFQKFNLSA